MKRNNSIKVPTKRGKRKWIMITVVSLICLLLLVNIAGGTYLFNYAIVSKDVSGMTLELDPAVAMSGKSAPIYINWYEEQSFEEIHMESHDGLDLVGFYLKNEQPSEKLAVLVHGYTVDNKIMAAFAKYYYEDGFNIFMADCRGHGQSEGSYVGMGWLDRLDYLQWLDLILERENENVQVVLHGISMGGATVSAMSGEELPKQVKAIVSDCAFDSVHNEFSYQAGKMVGLLAAPFLSVAGLESKLFAGYSFGEADIAAQVAKSQTPIFIIHGEDDSFTPVEMAYNLYEIAPEPKELWIVLGADHGKSFDIQPDVYFEQVRAFYSKYIN